MVPETQWIQTAHSYSLKALDIRSPKWALESSNQGARKLCSSWSPQGRIGFLAFPASSGSQHSLAQDPSSPHPQSQSSWAKFLSRCHFSGPVFPLSPLHLEGCLRLHCTQDKSRIISKILSQRISNFNSICKLNALLPRSLPYSQVPGFRTDIFGRSLPLTYELEGGRCFSWKGRGRWNENS